MARYSVHVRFEDELDEEAATAALTEYADEHESITVEDVELDADEDRGTTPGIALETGDPDALADAYEELRERPDVREVLLWGPNSERYPIAVYHHALRQISQPDRYLFHAVDGDETLVICENRRDLEQVRVDVGSSGLA